MWIIIALISSLVVESADSHEGASHGYVDMTDPALQFEVHHSRAPPKVVGVEASDEERLIEKLMEGYASASRPVVNSSKNVDVSFGLSLVQIQKMDEVNQIFHVYVWLELEWTDPRLRWDPADYGNIAVFRIPVSLLWMPDIVLYNSAANIGDHSHSRVMLSNNGRIFYGPPVKLHATCAVDISKYPFDSQTCYLRFRSWTYGLKMLNVMNRSSEIDLSNYMRSGEWDLIKTYVTRTLMYYRCCPNDPYTEINFFIVIKRRSLFYWLNIILPCMCFQVLNVLAFLLPIASLERVTLIVSTLLSYSVFMLLIADKVPSTSDHIPLLIQYLSIAMSLNAISLVPCVWTLNLYFGPPFNLKPMSHRSRKIFLYYIPRIMRIDTTVNWDLLRDDGTPPDSTADCPAKKPNRSSETKCPPIIITTTDRGRTRQLDLGHVSTDEGRESSEEYSFESQIAPRAHGCCDRSGDCNNFGPTSDMQHREWNRREVHMTESNQSNQFAPRRKPGICYHGNVMNRFGSVSGQYTTIHEGNETWRLLSARERQRFRIRGTTIVTTHAKSPAKPKLSITHREWRMFAYVLDRCFFCIFTLLSILAPTVLFIIIPNM